MAVLNRTIEVVTFRLRGLCMLGVFVASIHPSRVGPCDGNRLDLGLHSHPKEFWGNGVRTHVNSKGKIPSTGKILPGGGSNQRRCIKQDTTN